MKKKIFAVSLLVLVSILLAACGAPAATKMELPAGLMAKGGVIPGMGEHWFTPA